MPTASSFARINLKDVSLHSLTETETCAHIIECLDAKRGGSVVTVNLDHLLRCKRNLEYRAIVQRADLVVADGMPLVWATHILGTPLPERVAGSALCLSLAEQLARTNRSVFLLGGDSGVAQKAGQILARRFNGLRIAGTHCPPLGFENNAAELDVIRAALRASKPDVVYVALGSPKQEQLIERLRDELPNTWWMGVGISLSFITGDVKRASKWIQNSGLEWVHRLVQEPRRLTRRYLVDGIPFAIELMISSALHRIVSRPKINARHDAV